MIKSTALLLVATSGLLATTFTYNVAVNTSSLSATAGNIDFQFNPGDATSDLATAVISNFTISGPGSLSGVPMYFGDSSGVLPSSLKVANTFNDNEALQALTFGTALAFRVTITETLTGTADAGSVFNFSVFQPDGFTPLLTTDPNGVLASINLNTLGGSATSTTAAGATVTAAPEPGTILPFSAGFLILAISRFAIRTSQHILFSSRT